MRQTVRAAWARGLASALVSSAIAAAHAGQPGVSADVDANGLFAVVRDAVAAMGGPSGGGLRSGLGDRGEVRLEALVEGFHRMMKRHGPLTGRLAANEVLLAVDEVGTIVEVREGSGSRVVVDRAFGQLLKRPGAGLTLIHNHPGCTSLSASDLGQLGEPGVAAIVAIGNDGSIYGAVAGPAFDGASFESWLYPLTRAAVLGRLNRERPSQPGEAAALNSHIDHLIATALHKAGAIRYRARLAGSRGASFESGRTLAGYIVESVSVVLRDEVRQRMRRPHDLRDAIR